MATDARILANRRNAEHSTGPRTEEGKGASRLNALSHGLTAKQIVLPHESQEEWESLRDGIIDSYSPTTDLEHTLAVTVAETYWRVLRLRRMETAVMAARMIAISEANPDLQGDDALAVLMTDPAEMKRMALLLRYLTSAERAHARATKELRDAQKARLAAEEEAAAGELVDLDDLPEIGFVSQPGNLLEKLGPETAAWMAENAPEAMAFLTRT